jgi:hypothetical protein
MHRQTLQSVIFSCIKITALNSKLTISCPEVTEGYSDASQIPLGPYRYGKINGKLEMPHIHTNGRSKEHLPLRIDSQPLATLGNQKLSEVKDDTN